MALYLQHVENTKRYDHSEKYEKKLQNIKKHQKTHCNAVKFLTMNIQHSS